MFTKYQDYANGMNSRVLRSQNVSVGQSFYPGRPYQAWADTFNTKMINADDPRVPHTPVENMARGSQDQADGFLNRMTAADDLQLRGLGYIRPSGSMARNIRRVDGIPTIAANVDWSTTCANLDWRKWYPPLIGYLFGYPGVAPGTTNIVDVPQAAVDQVQAKWPNTLECSVNQASVAGSAFISWAKSNGFYTDAGGIGGPGFDKVVAAGRKMHEHGWWSNDDWYDYWTRWSGAEPFYKNPYIVGGIGVAGVATWFLLRKKRK